MQARAAKNTNFTNPNYKILW